MAPAGQLSHVWQGYAGKSSHGSRIRRDRHWALRDVSLAVERGEILGVVGGNGSGKTTMLRVLAGTLRPTRGEVERAGRAASLDSLGAGIARDLTGSENLLIAGVLLGMTRPEVRARAEEIAEFAGLPDDVLRSPQYTYSEGMSLRLAISIVMHSSPSLLLIDEILAVADDAFGRKCAARIHALKGAGAGVVLVSHDVAVIESQCDRVVVLVGGELRHAGPPGEALAWYLDEQTESEP